MYFFNLFFLVILILINLIFFGYSDGYNFKYPGNDSNTSIEDYYYYDYDYNVYQDVYKKFGVDKMFPSLPNYNLNVAIKGKAVNPGQYVAISDLLDVPLVSWDCGLCGPGGKFILFMFDGKGVGTFEGQKFVHLFLPTKACSTAQAALLPKLAYKFPTPFPATGAHPYIFALYCSNDSNPVEKVLSRTLFIPNKEGMPAPKGVHFVRSAAPLLEDLDVLPGNTNLPGRSVVAPLSTGAQNLAGLV